ncbi:MAG: hypothetical protein BAJALOKI1v1_2440007, partial [Promethearchaeota archaeon]
MPENEDVDVDDILEAIEKEEEEPEEDVEVIEHEIAEDVEGDGIIEIETNDIIIDVENREATEEAVEQMKRSIKANGVLVPVMIDGCGNLIDGERRVRACLDLEIEKIPTMVVEPNKIDSARIVTNFVRENFSEEYLKKVFEQELEDATQQDIADKYGITQARVSQIVNRDKDKKRKKGKDKSKKKEKEKKEKKKAKRKSITGEDIIDVVEVNDDIVLAISEKGVDVVFSLSNKDLENVIGAISSRVSEVDWSVIDEIRE